MMLRYQRFSCQYSLASIRPLFTPFQAQYSLGPKDTYREFPNNNIMFQMLDFPNFQLSYKDTISNIYYVDLALSNGEFKDHRLYESKIKQTLCNINKEGDWDRFVDRIYTRNAIWHVDNLCFFIFKLNEFNKCIIVKFY